MVDRKMFTNLLSLVQENKDNLTCLKEVHDLSILKDEQEITRKYNDIMNHYSLLQEKKLSIREQLYQMINQYPELLEKLSQALFTNPTLASLLEFYTYYLMWETVEPTFVRQKKYHS